MLKKNNNNYLGIKLEDTTKQYMRKRPDGVKVKTPQCDDVSLGNGV